jgi:hypothetical protein
MFLTCPDFLDLPTLAQTAPASVVKKVGCDFDHPVGCCAGHFRPQTTARIRDARRLWQRIVVPLAGALGIGVLSGLVMCRQLPYASQGAQWAHAAADLGSEAGRPRNARKIGAG